MGGGSEGSDSLRRGKGVKKVALLLTGMSLVVMLASASVVLALESTSSPTSERATAPEQRSAGSVIPGHYIVVLEDGVDNPSQVASGVFYSVAAGNDGKNACKYSPARAGAGTNNGIATVAATNKDDKEVRFSNYGSCVDIWAPGTDILSTEMGGGTTRMSGTSASAPHVGGGGALYLSLPSHTSASPSVTEGALKSAATKPGTTSKDGRRPILLENIGGF
jgi:subtilisin family serine protease